MVYRAIGLMSGSSLDGLDIACVEFTYANSQWNFEIMAADCIPYSAEWIARLQDAISLPAKEYLRLHSDYGHYLGVQVNEFIAAHELAYRVQLISSHGHTTFHEPPFFTGQLGDGAAIAAETGLPVVSDLRALDVALGGQGAPIVPMGEKLLLGDYPLLLNLGGIANVSAKLAHQYVAFDICPANRVLNLLAADVGKTFDEGGQIAASGFVRDEVLTKLNALEFYRQPFPKSLANDFGVEVVYPMLQQANLSVPDALRTMVEHISIQTARSVGSLVWQLPAQDRFPLLVTGGGAHNQFLLERLKSHLQTMKVDITIPDAQFINYKEAVVMALLGVLRWREENTVLHTVTGSRKSSIGGALWMGHDA